MPFLPTEARQLLDLQVGAVEPTLRVNGDALVADVDRWLDTSVTPAMWRLWDGAAWQPIGPVALGDLSDVDLSTPPTDQQALIYDDGTSTWKPGTVAATATTSIVPLANGDPDAPAYLFTPDGSGLFVEVAL